MKGARKDALRRAMSSFRERHPGVEPSEIYELSLAVAQFTRGQWDWRELAGICGAASGERPPEAPKPLKGGGARRAERMEDMTLSEQLERALYVHGTDLEIRGPQSIIDPMLGKALDLEAQAHGVPIRVFFQAYAKEILAGTPRDGIHGVIGNPNRLHSSDQEALVVFLDPDGNPT